MAVDKLLAAGLDSVPSWLRPFHVLSNGEQMRVELARTLQSKMVVDHFTTAIDRPSAQSMAASVGRFVRNQGLEEVVFVSPHTDIVPFLKPDWVYYTDVGKLRVGDQIPKYRIDLWEHPNVNEIATEWTDHNEYILPQQKLLLAGGGGPEGRRARAVSGATPGRARHPRAASHTA